MDMALESLFFIKDLWLRWYWLQFAQKVIQLFERDFPKFLRKRNVTKADSLFKFHNRSTKKIELIKNCAMPSSNSKKKL